MFTVSNVVITLSLSLSVFCNIYFNFKCPSILLQKKEWMHSFTKIYITKTLKNNKTEMPNLTVCKYSMKYSSMRWWGGQAVQQVTVTIATRSDHVKSIERKNAPPHCIAPQLSLMRCFLTISQKFKQLNYFDCWILLYCSYLITLLCLDPTIISTSGPNHYTNCQFMRETSWHVIKHRNYLFGFWGKTQFFLRLYPTEFK